jgi:GNAT superfamily N-acetyltransferase
VRELAPADAQAAAFALALAFDHDPHMRWIFRDDRRRLSRLARMWATLIERMWLEHGGCYVLKQNAGAAVWLPPDSWLISPAAQAQLVVPLLGATRDALPRLLRVHFFNDRKHPRQPAHWYLATTGVMPAWQARGYGQALLRPALERCDRNRVPAYLEATTPRNRAFYERNGFKVVEECTYAA